MRGQFSGFGDRARFVGPIRGASWAAFGALSYASIASGAAPLGFGALLLGGISAALSGRHARTIRQVADDEAMFRKLVQEIPAIIYVDAADDVGSAMYISPKLEEYIGYSADDWYSSPDFFVQILHPDDRERLLGEIAFNNAGNRNRSEYRVISKSGEVVWFYDESIPERDSQGRVVQTRGCMIDITDRKRAEAELSRKDDELRQAQKMEAIGLLAGGIAHDFNNLLTVIRGNVSLLVDDLGSSDPVTAEALRDVDEAAGRAAELTAQLLTMSRKQVRQPTVLDVGAVVRDLERMLGRTIGEDIRVSIAVADGLTRIRADRTQIEQLVLNLAVNARDAMPAGGKLRIEVTPSPGQVCLAVTDSGTGIPDSIRNQIFDPFFTTKPLGKGTGLGLSTVDGIVKQNLGTITVSSPPEGGTRFEVTFPASFEEPAPEADAQDCRHRTSGSGTILVVEDEAALRDLVVRTLTRDGYRVLSAADGSAALAMITSDPTGIDLLLTDVVMPGMGGRAVVEAARKVRADLNHLYMSGYTDDEILRRGIAHDEANLLPKPFTPIELLDAVADTLETRSRLALP